MGIFGASDHLRRGPPGGILRAGKHFRQHRQLADHRVQADRHQLRGSRPADRPHPAAGRQRDGDFVKHQHPAGVGAVRAGVDLHGHQRRRLLRGAEAGQLHRQQSDLHRCRQLHPGRRLFARQERLSRQRRGLLPRRRADRSRPPAIRSGSIPTGAEIPERLPALAGDHHDRLPRQPRQLSADHQARHLVARIGTAAPGRLRHQPADLRDTPPPVFSDNFNAGYPGQQQGIGAAAITTATLLSGRGPLPTRFCLDFAADDTITVAATTGRRPPTTHHLLQFRHRHQRPQWPHHVSRPELRDHRAPCSTRSIRITGNDPGQPRPAVVQPARSRCIPAPSNNIAITPAVLRWLRVARPDQPGHRDPERRRPDGRHRHGERQ